VKHGRHTSRNWDRGNRPTVLDGDHKALVDAALPVCARYGLAVAGGYAAKAQGLVERPSEAPLRVGGAAARLIWLPGADLPNDATEVGAAARRRSSWVTRHGQPVRS
jgi:hypothetical protein